MGYICGICHKTFNSSSFEDLNMFSKHVSKCPLRSDNFMIERFTCNFCGTAVRHHKSFKAHLLKCHPPNLRTTPSESAGLDKLKKLLVNSRERREIAFDLYRRPNPDVSVEVDVQQSSTSAAYNPQDAEQQNRSSASNNLSNEFLKIVTEVFAKPNVPMDGAEAVMKEMGKLLEVSCNHFLGEMDSVSQLLSSDDDRKILKDRAEYIAAKIKSSLQHISTEQKLKTVLVNKNVLELPERVTYFEKVVQVEDSIQTVKSEAIILPIEYQIKAFLQKPGILNSLLSHQAELESQQNGTVIQHFLNGKVWKTVKGKFEGKTVIPIFIYNDDFVPDDSLSPHGSSNKVSGFYSSFPSLPSKYNSTLESILVLMLAKGQEMKEAGVNKVLNILSERLKPLEDSGIEVNGQQIFIAPVLLMGDNLGLNTNLGFPLSFTATYYCRFCCMQKSYMDTCCKENGKLMRTQEGYQECLKNLDKGLTKGDKNYGVRSRCDLEKLKSFGVLNNFSVDIMHDLLSGVFVYGIREFVKKGISLKFFTLERFNTIKNEFDYGHKEAHYILEDITSPKPQVYSIRSHARELWCLMKFLPFILKKLVPQNSSLYKYGLLMVDLLDITFQNSFSTKDLEKLENLVNRHNKEFLRLFMNQDPPRVLTAKFHHLLHYVRVIKNSGPLKHLWSMRFEAKHQHLKSQAKVVYSRRNICYTFAKKICFQNALKSFSISDPTKYVKEFSRKRELFPKGLQSQLATYTSCKKVTLYGTIYAIDDYIFSNCCKFAFKIKQIAVDENNDKASIIVEKFKIEYIHHLRSYMLRDSTKEFECHDVEHFEYPPINCHLYENNFYLRKEEF